MQSFKKGKKEVAAKKKAAASKPTGKEITVRKPQAPAVPQDMGAGEDVKGEVDSSDIKLPYLSIVQNVGDLSALFDGGHIILGGEVDLTPKEEAKKSTKNPIEITVVWARKQLIEKLPFDSEERPRIFDTAEAAREAGLTTDWVDSTPPEAGPMLTCLVLAKRPKGVDESALFSLEYDGNFFAPALWSIRSTAYNRAGKAILTAKALAKNEPLSSRKFTLGAKFEKVGQNWIYTPVIRAVGKHDAGFISFIAENAK